MTYDERLVLFNGAQRDARPDWLGRRGRPPGWTGAAAAGGEPAAALLVRMVETDIAVSTSARIDYVAGVSMRDLRPLERVELGNTMVALAAFFGRIRLIDNVRF